MAKRGPGFQAKLCALQHGTEEAFLIAVQKLRFLANFRAWKDLLRTMSSMVPVFVVAATAEARAFAGATVFISSVVVDITVHP